MGIWSSSNTDVIKHSGPTNVGLVSEFPGGGAPTPPFTNTMSLLTNGVNQYVDVGTGLNANFDFNKAYSISAWVNFSALVGGFACIGGNTGPSPFKGVQFNIFTSFIDVLLINNFTTNKIRVQATRTAVANVWSHIVICYNGNGLASGVTVYANGLPLTLVVAQDNLAGLSTVSTANFRLANDNNGGDFLNGHLDEVSLWTKALTALEVTTLYNAGHPQDFTTLSAWNTNGMAAYRFEGTANDLKGLNNGTLINGATFSTLVP